MMMMMMMMMNIMLVIIIMIKVSPVRGCDIGIGVPPTRGMTKMKSKSMLVLLVPLNRYVCFPAPIGTVSVQGPGLGLATSNIVTLDIVVFPTELPRGSLSVIFGELLALEIVTIILSIVSSTINLYSFAATLRFFLPIIITSPPVLHVVPVRSTFVKFFIFAISGLDFGSLKIWPQESLASSSNGR